MSYHLHDSIVEDCHDIDVVGDASRREELERRRQTDPKYRPPPLSSLLQARQHQQQQSRMVAILKEIAGYLLYLALVLNIAYLQTDNQAFYLKHSLSQTIFHPLSPSHVDFHQVSRGRIQDSFERDRLFGTARFFKKSLHGYPIRPEVNRKVT